MSVIFHSDTWNSLDEETPSRWVKHTPGCVWGGNGSVVSDGPLPLPLWHHYPSLLLDGHAWSSFAVPCFCHKIHALEYANHKLKSPETTGNVNSSPLNHRCQVLGSSTRRADYHSESAGEMRYIQKTRTLRHITMSTILLSSKLSTLVRVVFCYQWAVMFMYIHMRYM